MKQSFCVFVLASILSIPFYGQNQKVVDSLLQITESNASNKERVDIYLKIAFEHVGSDSSGYNSYIAKGLDLADSIGYEEGKMDALYVMSRSSLLSGDYERSDVYLSQLMDGSSQLNYQKGIADALYGRAWLNYYRGAYAESISLHKKSLEIRETLDDQIPISDCLRGLGITYKLLGEFDKALDFLNRSLEIEREINNPGGVATCLNHIGIINSLRGDYSSAMDIYFRALVIEQELDDKSGLAYTYQNIGVIHDQQKDYEKALEYYNKSLDLRQEIGEVRGVAQIINNIGIVYHKLGDFGKALTNYEEALSIKEALGDKRGMADGNLNIGRLYTDQSRHKEAIAYKKRALKIANEINSDWGKVESLISLGKSYHALKRYDDAKKYLTDGIELAQEAQLVGSVRDGAGFLAQVEKETGNFEDAFEAMVLFQMMSDSISSEEAAKQITLLEAKFEFEQERDSIQFANEKARLLLDQRIKTQRSTQIAGLIAVVVLIIVIVILSRYSRLKIESNKRLSVLNDEIQRRNESLSALNDEKNNLIGIVAHDLQNPLSGIVSAVDLFDPKDLKDDQKKLMELIQMSSSRMLSMIRDILNVEAIEKNVETANIKSYNLSNAVHDVCNRFLDQAKAKRINLCIAVEPGILVLADERYAVQIVENLVSNAIKFSPEGKEIGVKLTVNEDKVILAVIDNGPGLSDQDMEKLFQRFQRLSAKPTGNENSTGLGLSIVKQLVEKMGGKIWCESELGRGASFFVELELSRS